MLLLWAFSVIGSANCRTKGTPSAAISDISCESCHGLDCCGMPLPSHPLYHFICNSAAHLISCSCSPSTPNQQCPIGLAQLLLTSRFSEIIRPAVIMDISQLLLKDENQSVCHHCADNIFGCDTDLHSWQLSMSIATAAPGPPLPVLSVSIKHPIPFDGHSSEPSEKRVKWKFEAIQLRFERGTWSSIAKELPGRLHDKSQDWDNEKRNKIARLTTGS
jgi:hypothetical protein